MRSFQYQKSVRYTYLYTIVRKVNMDLSEDTIASNGFTIKQNRIITKVLCLFLDSVSVYKTWGFYMFDREFDDEQELRNRIGIIILASLFDPLLSIKKVEHYMKDAKNNNLIHVKRYCNQILEYFESIKELLQQYSKAEQVFIVYLRNQYVHSFLSGRHEKNYNIRYVENYQLKTENISIAEFDELTRDMFENYNLDQLLKNLIDKWLTIECKYSNVIRELIVNENFIYDSIYHGREVKFKWLNA